MAVGTIMGGADTSPLVNATATDRSRSEDFFRKMAQLQQEYEQQLQQQSALGRSYDQVIAGTAPSVAGTQLAQGLDRTNAAINANAAGATAPNAGLAQYGAIQAMGAARAKQEQDAALLRAQEVEKARAGKAALLGQQQAATGGMAGTVTGAGTALSGQASGTAGQIVSANESEIAARRAFLANLLQGGGSALMAAAA